MNNVEKMILIVDDLRDNRLAMKIALKNEGYILEEATNGKEAIEMCKVLKPDVILMDAMMPLMDGYEAIKQIRKIEEFERTPILMVTALNDKDDKIKALNYGVNDFISKPFNKHELIARCKSYISLSQINKQYVHASKNPRTNLLNKSALIDNIQKCQNPKLVLFRIEDYEVIEEFYTEEIASAIESKFSEMIYDLVSDECKTASLYHTSEGEFALLKDDIENKITNQIAIENCSKFYANTKESIIKFKEYEYDINIVLSYSFGKDNLFEHSRVGLNHAIKEKENIVFANDIIDQVRKDATNNIKTIKMIKTALNTNNVVSYFQPLLNNKTKQIEKYESLVRIIDTDGKVISPFFFLDIAKKGKYYNQITQQVINNSLKALENTTKDISINLSAVDIENDYIRDMIIRYFDKNPQLASRVVFELLEDESVKNFKIIVDFIAKVKTYGVKIAIDDFGAGYSNFERLLDFQPDIVKIDGSLIKNIHTNKFSRNIVETMQDFATKMNIKTVAEFVHCQEVLDIVNEIGIDYTQGYHISAPVAKID
ncbi:MAG: EAL domain-containing protein [Campylobacterota bacterium]|nr:EAL domain-containing protein [Campylobacterota bacterium]